MSPLPGDSQPSEGISLAQNTTGDSVRKRQNRARALDRLWEVRTSKARPTVQVRTLNKASQYGAGTRMGDASAQIQTSSGAGPEVLGRTSE